MLIRVVVRRAVTPAQVALPVVRRAVTPVRVVPPAVQTAVIHAQVAPVAVHSTHASVLPVMIRVSLVFALARCKRTSKKNGLNTRIHASS